MILTSVSLSRFRNIAGAEIDFSPGVNVLWGENAQGKSNILEAIYYCARGRSFRGAPEKLLIQTGEEMADILVTFRSEKSSYDSTLRYVFPKEGKKVMERDGIRIRSAGEMVGRLSAILFTPQHLSLVSGSPGERRAFLDVAIAMCHPPYVRALSVYKRALEERNALLRESARTGLSPDASLLETYADTLSEAGAFIVTVRGDYIRRLDILAAEQMLSLSGGRDALSLSYRPDILDAYTPPEKAELSAPLPTRGDPAVRDALRNAFLSDVPREILLKTTCFGPQKDDLEILLNGQPARQFASQGQCRSTVLSLKLSEGTLSALLLGERPLYLLDDVLSELDESRRTYLLTKLKDDQLILTSCEPDFRVRNALDFPDARRLQVINGTVTPME